jgi:AraC family transcriptional activator of pobA
MAASLPTVAFRPKLALELELISLRRLLASKAPALRVPVRATFYQVVWVQRGQARHTVDLQRVTLEAGSLLFVGPGRVHTFDLTADYEGQVLLFTDAFFARSAAAAQFLHTTSLFQQLLDVPLVLVDRPDSPLPALWAQLATELRQAPDAYQPVVLQQLVHTFLLLAERAQRQQGQQLLDRSPSLAYTVQFRALVEQQFQVARSVRGYAAQLHLSAKRLAQATTHVLGKLPKQVIDERVTLEAKRLLTHTPASIKEIGFALGFGEPTNFIKYFRRQTGLTPHEFREKHTR